MSSCVTSGHVMEQLTLDVGQQTGSSDPEKSKVQHDLHFNLSAQFRADFCKVACRAEGKYLAASTSSEVSHICGRVGFVLGVTS